MRHVQGKVDGLLSDTKTVTGDGWYRTHVGEDTWELRQQFTVEPDEDPFAVARSFIGPKGEAVFVTVTYEDGQGWPWAVFHGTVHELAAIVAKCAGSRIGKPPKEVTSADEEEGD